MRHQTYNVRKLPTWSIKEARAALERLVGAMNDWAAMDEWLADYLAEPSMRRSVKASSFTASLELAREGVLESARKRRSGRSTCAARQMPPEKELDDAEQCGSN